MEFLQTIEQLGFVRLLKTSFIAYPVINALHIAAIGALFTSVLLIDFSVLGWIRSIPSEKLTALMRRIAFAAFAVAVLTGLALFSVRAIHYAEMPVFLAKMGLIVLAILNFLVFMAQARQGAEMSSFALRLSAVISILLWSGVLLAGRFIGFV